MLGDSSTNSRTVAVHDINNLLLHQNHGERKNEECTYARRETSLVDEVAHLECRQRGEFRRFHDDSVSCRKSRPKLPGDHKEGEVPRDDLADYSNRFVASIAKLGLGGLDGLASGLVPEVLVRIGILSILIYQYQ